MAPSKGAKSPPLSSVKHHYHSAVTIVAVTFTKPSQKAAQDAPVIDAEEEWAFLIWGLGRVVLKRLFVQLFSFLDTPLNI